MGKSTTVNMIYIGNFDQMDTSESSLTTENPEYVLGTYTDLELISVTNYLDNESDSLVRDDDAPDSENDYITYDTGTGVQSQAIDSTDKYTATVTSNGTSSETTLLVIQTVTGDAFIVEYSSYSLDDLKISSINIHTVDTAGFTGYYHARSIDDTTIACFSQGTFIDTQYGPEPVESLREGMLVRTLDHGYQPVCWVNATYSPRAGENAYIQIPKRSLGADLPHMELRVSPQHRILVGSKIVERMTGNQQMLVAAKHLLDHPRVTQSLQFLPATYHHFACENHEIVFANGMPVETFYAGEQAFKALTNDAQMDLLSKLPKLRKAPPSPARKFMKSTQARQMVARHIKNRCNLAESLTPGQSCTVV